MRALALAAALLCAAACAVPTPCTRALCPVRVDGSYRVTGWRAAVTVSSGVPQIPITSDAQVEILSGEIEFANNSARVRASEGAVFHLEVSTQAQPTPLLFVSSGSVSVAQTPGASFQAVAPGANWRLPTAPKPSRRPLF
jgi:hypothetical protein